MKFKSERLKKLESELADLQQWLKLGLVPKKDITKHKEEIEEITIKIDEEQERLRYLKESGEVEEYTPPKRHGRASYQEPQSMPEMPATGNTEAGEFNMASESFEEETTATGEETSSTSDTTETETHSQIYDDDDDPFSDKNRWKRGILEDPDADNW